MTLRRLSAHCLIVAAALAGFSWSDSARADVYTFKTPAGTMAGGSGPVNAEADFTTANGSLTITLKDLQSDPGNVGQLPSSFAFTLGNGGSLTGATLTGASAQEVTVNGGGPFVVGSNLSTPASVGWVYSTSSSVDALLDVLNGTGHAGPSHLIIGPPGGTTYASANGSIAGNGPHNAFLNQSATFTLTGAGLTLATTITSATFAFGTGSPVDRGGQLIVSSVPEPSPLALAATAIPLALGGSSWRLRKRATA